jgi:hypothetical protein
VEKVLEHLHASGARERVESRIASLLAEARRELATLAVGAGARSILEGATTALVERES